jgi:MYXO-CTERM domain-containing protein
MKKTLLTLALAGLSAVATYAQGTIQFLNSGLSPVKYESAPGVAAVNTPINIGAVVGVFWGATADSLTLQTPTAKINTTAGVFNGGAVYGLTGSQPGQTVFLKFAGWVNLGGTTPDTITGRNDPGITHYGETTVVQTIALAPTAGPGLVVWEGAAGTNPNRANAFTIQIVPEPSVVALGALGLGALLLIRRRKA